MTAMKGQGLACLAVLSVVVIVGQVHAAPADVNAGQLVDRLKELLQQRQEEPGGPGLSRDVRMCNVHTMLICCSLDNA